MDHKRGPIKLSAIAKGLLTFVLPSSLYSRSGGGTHSARYCYAVYLRHLSMLGRAGAGTAPATVAEIGPGNSIGVGLAALIAGAERYYGFDVKAYGKGPGDAAIFDDLVTLFRQRAAIPDDGEFPNINPKLEGYDFPSDILTEERLAAALAPQRIARLRAALFDQEDVEDAGPASYIVPWFSPAVLRENSIDWIFSQAVLEHVDDLEATYAACFNWLKPGSCMSHQIDFKCHGTANLWNGHWAYSRLAWRAVRGARPYLINRRPHSAHLDSLRRANFAVRMDQKLRRGDGLTRSALAEPYSALSDDDLATAGAFMISARPES